MAILNLTNFSAALKELYPRGLRELWYPRAPFLSWVPKKTDFVGSAAAVVPIISGNRGSTNFSDAVTLTGNPTTVKFLVTRRKDYSIASVDSETLLASGNDRGAIARAVDTSIRAGMYEMGRSLAFQSWGNGGGARGRCAVIAADTVTLTNVNDVVFFEIGMICQRSTDDGQPPVAGVLGTQATVVSVDRQLGTVTFGAGEVAAWGLAVNNYIFRQGDYGNCMAGVQSWLTTPLLVPLDNFFGVNRTVDSTRLAGVKFNGGGSPIEDSVFDASAEAAINGGDPDTLWMNNKRFAELQKSANSKTWIDVQTDIPDIGYRAMSFAGPQGEIKVMSDPSCPYAIGVLAKRDSWELKSLGEAPHFATDDGQKLLRDAGTDSVQFRIRSYHNLICKEPGHNCLITW